jgi:hypothetical protein
MDKLSGAGAQSPICLYGYILPGLRRERNRKVPDARNACVLAAWLRVFKRFAGGSVEAHQNRGEGPVWELWRRCGRRCGGGEGSVDRQECLSLVRRGRHRVPYRPGTAWAGADGASAFPANGREHGREHGRAAHATCGGAHTLWTDRNAYPTFAGDGMWSRTGRGRANAPAGGCGDKAGQKKIELLKPKRAGNIRSLCISKIFR